MEDLDSVNRQLAQVVDALRATPDDDFAARHALRTEQDRLRGLASHFRVDADLQRSTVDLERELVMMEQRLEAVYDSGIDLVTQAGGGSGTGGSFTSAAEGGLNFRIREASGLGAIQSRIAHLREILAVRAADQG